MRVVIPDHDVRQWLGVGRRAALGEAIMDYLYKDPRFDTARERLLGDWLVRTLVASIRAGEDVSDGGER
jgi:hypothetical protein